MTNNLKEALIKDFKQLLQKEFTTDWKIQRMVRELEIGVMSLDNTEALINQKEKELLGKVEKAIGENEYTIDPEGMPEYLANELVEIEVRNKLRAEQRDRIKQLKEELKEVSDE
jgi:hypothetical protein